MTTYLISLPVLWLMIKFIEYKWKQAGTSVPAPMRKMALALIGIAAILLIYSAEKKQTSERPLIHYTGRSLTK